MAFEYTINQERKLALLVFSGSVTGTELVSATETLYNDPAWPFGADAIWDFSEITELLLEWNDLTGLVGMDKFYEEVAGPGRDIFVVSRKLDEAMGQIHGHLSKAGPRRSQVCASMEHALEIIDEVTG